MTNFLKLIAQPVLDRALPGIKTQLITLLSAAIIGNSKIPSDVAQIAIAAVTSAVNNWTIKLQDELKAKEGPTLYARLLAFTQTPICQENGPSPSISSSKNN